MRTVLIILSSLTMLMLLSELICGLWLRSHGSDPSSITFHSQLGIATVVMTMITVISMLVYIFKR